jgi:hypothetical protein
MLHTAEYAIAIPPYELQQFFLADIDETANCHRVVLIRFASKSGFILT